MALLKPKDEELIRKKLSSFLKNRFKSSVKKNYMVFQKFAPDYYIKKKNGKKIIVIFRNPPEFSDVLKNDIRLASKEGLSVYIAIFNHEFDSLLDKFLEECDNYGVGVIQISNLYECKILQPSLLDLPKLDEITENRIKIFISSKLWIPEREMVRNILFKYKHQPICVERLANQSPVEETCYNWIKKSRFFVGVITRQYRPIVDKEIKFALKSKKKKCIIYIRNDCFQEEKLKLKKLIDFSKKYSTVFKFVNEN